MAAVARAQQLLSKLKGAVEPAYKLARTEVVKQYEVQMAKNAEYVVKDKAAADKLLKQWFYTQLSRWVWGPGARRGVAGGRCARPLAAGGSCGSSTAALALTRFFWAESSWAQDTIHHRAVQGGGGRDAGEAEDLEGAAHHRGELFGQGARPQARSAATTFSGQLLSGVRLAR